MTEKTRLHFRVAAVPPRRTAQQKGVFVRNGRAHFYTKSAVRQEESNTVALVLSKLPKDWRPIEGPVSLSLRLVYPYRKGEPKRRTACGNELPHDRKPDLDNLAKGIVDSIVTAGVVYDDSQFANMNLSKRWGPTPYWEVDVAEIGWDGDKLF